MGDTVITLTQRDVTISNISSVRGNMSRKHLVIGQRRRIFRALIKFNLSFLPRSLLITNAHLLLNLERCTYGRAQPTLDIHQVVTPWIGSQLSWNQQPLFEELPLLSVPMPLEEPLLTIDITPLVQAWCNGDKPNFGVLLKVSDETSPYLMSFFGQECRKTAMMPSLRCWCRGEEKECLDPLRTINVMQVVVANNTIQYTKGQEVLIFDYSYFVVNLGNRQASACLECSADNQHWEIESSTKTIEPGQSVGFGSNRVTRYARLCYQTKGLGDMTTLHVYVQGRAI